MRIVPVQNDPNNTWHSWAGSEFRTGYGIPESDRPYFSEVLAAQKSETGVKQMLNFRSFHNTSKPGVKTLFHWKSKADSVRYSHQGKYQFSPFDFLYHNRWFTTCIRIYWVVQAKQNPEQNYKRTYFSRTCRIFLPVFRFGGKMVYFRSRTME